MDGKYRVRAHLSSGGMGDVYEAEHVYTHRQVALKVMRHRTEGAEQLFVREAEAVCAVDHPGVVEMLDAGRSQEGTWYAVFELLEGLDLEAIFSGGGLGAQELTRVTLDLLRALAATHAEGYVHRDVKPANVFISFGPTGAGQVKLLDFGIAERMGPDGAPALGHRVGTLEYMSPEQAQGHNVDGRTDVWSVGALLFRGLTGRSPIVARRSTEALRRLVFEDVPSVGSLREGLPADLVAVVDRAVARDPERRWASAADMAQALLCLDSEELRCVEPPSPAPPPTPVRRPSQRRFCIQSTVDLLPQAS